VTIPQGLDRIKHKHPPGQLQLFSSTKSTQDWGPTQKFKAQLKILGVSLELSPLEQFADQIQTSGAVSTLEAQEMIASIDFCVRSRTWLKPMNNFGLPSG